MPIEVRELVIKATITQENVSSGNIAGAQASNNNVSPAEEIINACVEKVIEILKDKHER